MNAAKPTPTPQALLADADPISRLSALVDGELDTQGCRALWAGDGSKASVLETWHSYQVIGEVLRSGAAAQALQAPPAFLDAIRARLQAEPVPGQAPGNGAQVLSQASDAVKHVRAPAANDPVFRWKMLAGLASVAAVAAVSWQVLSTTPSAGASGAEPLLAQAVAPEATRTAAPQAPATAVVVNTQQGPVIRDARLEKLLAEHRQYGGMSALQMPAGFLRNATYDAPAR